MAIIDPNLQIKLAGTNLNNFTKTLSWTDGEQLEQKINILDTDGLTAIDYSFVDYVKAMIFQSTSTFTVTIVAGGVTSTITVDSIFLFNPEPTYLDTITSISVSTDSVTSQVIDIRIYGGAS